MTLTAQQREFLDGLADFTEDTFLQPQYASWLLPKLRELRDQGEPLSPDHVEQWAREREWPETRAAFLGGIAWAVRYGD